MNLRTGSTLVGGSMSLSGLTLFAAISQETLTSWGAFAATASATAFGWWIARQAESREAERVQARLDAEAKREERMEDLIQQVTIARIAHGEEMAAAKLAAQAVLADAARTAAAVAVKTKGETP